MSLNGNIQKIVISASRRTDIPAYYMGWFMQQIKKGFFQVTNPYNRKTSIVPATPQKVHSIVFWSKNYETFIKNNCGKILQDLGFNIFFNFTINTYNKTLEPNLPTLEARLDQMAFLSETFGNETINWRFDPICHYSIDGVQFNNLHDFIHIAESVSKSKIRRCITSFADIYRKVHIRGLKTPGFKFTNIPLNEKTDVILRIKTLLTNLNICLFLCCEKEVIESLPLNSNIYNSSCIDNILLQRLFGDNISFAKDGGQRTKSGCDCKKSYDIGSYIQHPCNHNCLYCYANPTTGQ